ncbi:MAG TPA: hypothetical protein VJL29_13270 [Thermoguttaceae bacterium]|nr:hypothetical protein [Thermoguttaceae bacterium]
MTRMRCSLLLAAFVVAAAVVGAAVGCGHRANYPKAKVTSPLGRPGVCSACKKKIESVADANLVVIDGVQYVICDDPCVAKLRKQLEWENGR